MRYILKHQQIASHLGFQNYPEALKDLYIDKCLSGIEISEYLKQNIAIDITPRAIQRTLKKYNIVRTVKEAFNLAIKKNRVKWAYKALKFKKRQLCDKLRYKIMIRDNFTCQLCGKGKDGVLEVDHIVPKCQGGDDNDNNLRTTCHACNVGRYLNKV